jgi:3-deoxy-D-arabino-heptulosonate 7-phosphate (DAHP) synthase
LLAATMAGNENDHEISEVCRRSLGSMLPRLLDRTHRMEPSDTLAVLAEEAAAAGLDDLQIYLVDKQQGSLIDAQNPTDRVPLVGTILGDAYST